MLIVPPETMTSRFAVTVYVDPPDEKYTPVAITLPLTFGPQIIFSANAPHSTCRFERAEFGNKYADAE